MNVKSKQSRLCPSRRYTTNRRVSIGLHTHGAQLTANTGTLCLRRYRFTLRICISNEVALEDQWLVEIHLTPNAKLRNLSMISECYGYANEFGCYLSVLRCFQQGTGQVQGLSDVSQATRTMPIMTCLLVSWISVNLHGFEKRPAHGA